MKCPFCDRELLLGEEKFICEKCHGFFPKGTLLEKIDLDPYPTMLAIPILEYYMETNPYIKLIRLFHGSEIICRFLTAVCLNDILRQKGEFPESIKKALFRDIERPTFGVWKNLLLVSYAKLGKKDLFIPELPELIGPMESEIRKVIKTRNTVIHSGRIANAHCRQHILELGPLFDRLVENMAFFSGYGLFGVSWNMEFTQLSGLSNTGEQVPAEDPIISTVIEKNTPIGSDQVLLIRRSDREALELFPLSAYCEVFRWEDDEAKPTGTYCPQLYFRRGSQDYIEYTTFEPGTYHSQNSGQAFERFQQIFKLKEWRQMHRDPNALSQYSLREYSFDRFSFNDIIEPLVQYFVGRENEISALEKWIEKANEGLLWIAGKPGIGKTALMAKVGHNIKDIYDEKKWFFLQYYFKASNQDTCNRMSFLEAAIVKLLERLGRPPHVEINPKSREVQFHLLLEELSENVASSKSGGMKIVFMVDGMDEINRIDDEFMETIFNARFPRVQWICSGRDEDELLKAFGKDRCQWLFPEKHGIPDLSSEAVRGFLIEKCDRAIYQLLKKDRETDDGKWINSFIDTLVLRCEGLPLYLQLLVKDIQVGRYDFSDERKLPDGLNTYYDEIMDRMGLHACRVIIHNVIILLALSKEPLTFLQLKALIGFILRRKDKEVRKHEFDKRMHRTLEMGQIMMKKAITATGELGYDLYHDSFTRYILETERIWEIRDFTEELLCDFCMAPEEIDYDPGLRKYAVKYGVTHLMEADRWCDAIILLHRISSKKELKKELTSVNIYEMLEDLFFSLDDCPENEASRLDTSIMLDLLIKLDDVEPVYSGIKLLHKQGNREWMEVFDQLIATGTWITMYTLSLFIADLHRENRGVGLSDIIGLTRDGDINKKEMAFLTLKTILGRNPGELAPDFFLNYTSEAGDSIVGGIIGEIFLYKAMNGTEISPFIRDSDFSEQVWDYNKVIYNEALAGELLIQGNSEEFVPGNRIREAYNDLKESEEIRKQLLEREGFRKEKVLIELLEDFYKLPIKLDLIRKAEDALNRSPNMKKIIRLLFSSPYWEVRERTAYVLNSLTLRDPDNIAIVRKLLKDGNWRVRYGALEAAADTFWIDDFKLLSDAIRRCHVDENCLLRALSMELINWYVFLNPDEALKRQRKFVTEIQALLMDTDGWVLDRVHHLFNKLGKTGDDLSSFFEKGISPLLKANPAWHSMSRTDFLNYLETQKDRITK